MNSRNDAEQVKSVAVEGALANTKIAVAGLTLSCQLLSITGFSTSFEVFNGNLDNWNIVDDAGTIKIVSATEDTNNYILTVTFRNPALG